MDLKQTLKTSPKYIWLLKAHWINSLKDFFLYFPRTYEDRTQIKQIKDIQTDWKAQLIKAYLIKKNIIKTPKGKKIIQIQFEDTEKSKGEILFIYSPYILKSLNINKRYIIIWKPKLEYWKIIFWHPELEETWDNWWNIKTNRIYPVYTELWGINSNWFAKKIWENLNLIENTFEEPLPKDFLEKFDLIEKKESIKNIHFPPNFDILKKSKKRIYFEKLLEIQLISLINRKKYQEKGKKEKIETAPDRQFIKQALSRLPFELTKSQKESLKEIIDDFHSTKPMMRLLQWDVGSGKTIISILAAYYISNFFDWQIAFLAPTEVLAKQHFNNLAKFFLPLWIKTHLLTWSTKPKEKEKIKFDLENWNVDIVIWTHAIIQEDIKFKKIKMAIIDEQQRFWVLQRAFFNKFWSPHILQMTATPIPRSMALAFFGEFNTSVINEMPLGRKPIHTKILTEEEFKKLKNWILTKINQWQRVYIISPLIEESEYLEDTSSVLQEYEETKKLFQEMWEQIWILHWKLKQEEKNKVMEEFKKWKIKILVSTTVIEVWVDIPKASIIIIKSPERFWLSQLHQLRGRVWRSNIQSYCFPVINSKWESYKRLKSLEKYRDWFKLAEIDLQERGSWEILWIKQSWEADIPIKILLNKNFLKEIHEAAKRLITKNPNLNWLKNLKEQLRNKDKNILI